MRRIHSYTYADYIAVESIGPGKHEYLNGEIYAMSGGSEEHSALSARVVAALDRAVADKPCRVHSSDLRIYVEAIGLATFPDASVICGPMLKHPPGPDVTALNPMVLVEVTSPSSEAYDLGDKLEYYQTIPTVRDIILVSHRERRITVHHRAEKGWTVRVATAGGRVTVVSLDMDLVVDEIYRLSDLR